MREFKAPILNTLTPEQQVADAFNDEKEDPERADRWDSDLCRNVRKLVVEDIEEGTSPKGTIVLQPIDGDPVWMDFHPSGGSGVHRAIIKHRFLEGVYVMEMGLAVEKPENPDQDINMIDHATYASCSPTLNLIKELNSDDSISAEEKNRQLEQAGLVFRPMVVRCLPVASALWVWFQERSEWVFMDCNQYTPQFNMNPFANAVWELNEKMSYSARETPDKMLLIGVEKYETSTEKTGRSAWYGPKGLGWVAGLNGLFYQIANIEIVAYSMELRFSKSDDWAVMNQSQSLYKEHRSTIDRGLKMFDDLLSDRELFDKSVEMYSPSGRQRAFDSFCGRVERVRKLMREVDRRHEGAKNN